MKWTKNLWNAYFYRIPFNKSINDGSIPSKWKVAEVRPIFKKGNKTTPGNYRPVSLTSIVCKVFEGFIRDKLLSTWLIIIFYPMISSVFVREGLACYSF